MRCARCRGRESALLIGKAQVRSADTDKEDSQVDDVGDPAPRERGEHEVLGGNLGVVDGPDVPGLGNAAGNRGGDAGELEHGEQERNLEHAQAVDNGEGDRADTENGQRATEQAERRADSKDDGQQQGAGGDDGAQALLEEDGVAVGSGSEDALEEQEADQGSGVHDTGCG